MDIKFISYTGRYPNLCAGTLTLEINGIERNDFDLSSGGNVFFDKDWCEHVEEGEWSVSVPKDLEKFKTEIEEIVNSNVPFGCCGGCV